MSYTSDYIRDRIPGYSSFVEAKARCTNTKHYAYKYYGARGIKWLFPTIAHAIDEIGPRPEKGLCLDRVDNERHYEPGNIQWTTRVESARNRRHPACAMFRDVALFQKRILNIDYPKRPAMLDKKVTKYQIACLEEELNEIKSAKNIVDVVDGIIDQIYFGLGWLYKMGVPVDQVWAAVHKANMTKVRGMTKRGVDGDAAKPVGWQDPKEVIRGLLS